MSKIKFGTDGWRAIVGEDFNEENVNKVLNGVATYIYEESKFDKKIIIGYDPRNKADDYALHSAKKLASYGFDVLLADKITATPVIAYAALNRDAYALMFTASHNPPEYLGIKFIPPYGGPAEDSMVNKIVENLEIEFKNKSEEKEYEKISFDEEYLEHIKKIINFDKINQSEIIVNYDAHHGAAGKLFAKILDMYDISCIIKNINRDINFGGQMPDPKEKYLKDLKKLCESTSAIGLSNDGDGDRFGVFDEKGNFIKADYIIPMLLKYLVKNRNYTGKMAVTAGAGAIQRICAEKLGIEVVETPVGFKWLGSVMRKDDIIIAGEESGGLSIKGHIPEKDGIIANLLIIEMLAYENKTLNQMYNELLQEVNRRFISDRVDLKLENDKDKDEIIEKIKTYEFIGDYRIIKKNTIDGLKLYLDDGSTILVRKSGTEPLLRIYIETDKDGKMTFFKRFANNQALNV